MCSQDCQKKMAGRIQVKTIDNATGDVIRTDIYAVCWGHRRYLEKKFKGYPILKVRFLPLIVKPQARKFIPRRHRKPTMYNQLRPEDREKMLNLKDTLQKPYN